LKQVSADVLPATRKRATQKRTLDTRRKILEVAVEEFAEHGYEGVSTRTIAANAGVQHTLVSYHFSGKEGLWREAISSILADRRTVFDARLEGLRGVDDVTKLKLLYEDFIRFAAVNLNFHRIMSHVASSPSPQLDWLIDSFLRESFDRRAALIASAQKIGRFVQGDPYHLEYVFIGAITRIFMLSAEVERIMGRSPYDPEFVEEHVRVCLSLFFRDPPPATKPTSRRRNQVQT